VFWNMPLDPAASANTLRARLSFIGYGFQPIFGGCYVLPVTAFGMMPFLKQGRLDESWNTTPFMLQPLKAFPETTGSKPPERGSGPVGYSKSL